MSKRKLSDNGSSKRRKDVLPPSLEQVHLNAAGIDVGAEFHFVAVPNDRDSRPVRRFGAFTCDLEALADWLEACGIEHVVMESTGVYWIPLFELLETRGFQVLLVDPRRLKSVPGRKSDVLDCQWLQQLHTFGLLQGAFRPDEQTCMLRSYLRHRSNLVSYASHHVQHMQKALTQMNLKLQHVISDVTGLTGMRIIDAILQGERDPVKLAKLSDPRCKNSTEVIAKALHGNWRDDHLFELRQSVEMYGYYQRQMADCDVQIETHLRTFSDQSGGQTLPPPRKRRRHTNEPAFELRQVCFRMAGVDLTQIDGVDGHSALKLLSEIGTDLSHWPSVKHFTSWLCLCPGTHNSGKKQGSGKTRRSANRAAATLRLAAQALYRSDSALGAFLRRKRAQLGMPKAITATAHKLARIVYVMLTQKIAFTSKSAAEYEKHYHERVLDQIKRRAKTLGYKLIQDTQLTPNASPA